MCGLGIMTINAVFQELGKYECLRQAVNRLLSRTIKLAGKCLSAVLGMPSCPGALADGRHFIIDQTSLGVVNIADLDLTSFISFMELVTSGRCLPGFGLNCPCIVFAKSSAWLLMS